MPDNEEPAPDLQEVPDLPTRETLAGYLGEMLVVRGIGLPEHGEPWHLVQVTEPTETGSVNEDPIMAFEVLFLAPAERDDGTYIFTNENNEMVGAMFCEFWQSPTGAPCMRSMFSSVVEEPGEEDFDNEAIPEG